MLILAGVTLNAAIGDNGIISQAQYATFLNEMAAVEEAVALWKINQKESAIPANGLCQEETLSVATNKNAERLNGEVGYYRVWSVSETMPAISVLADVETFNNNFGAEVVYFPAGAQDLYYLDNEGLGIDSKKEYIIDAVNSMVYSTTGITIKGVRVYSTAMAKAVMNGNVEAPLFAEAEVSGTGAEDEILAGNVQDEYLPDGTKNPDYNPYGFQIITDHKNYNVYKLYNNGDLYAKGVKGNLLNTDITTMENIDSTLWRTLEIPQEVTNYKSIIPGVDCVYIVDSLGFLWAYGSNNYNRFGLSKEQQIEYTGRDAVKLDIDGKTVEKVFSTSNGTYVVTSDNLLYAAGYNAYGNLGIGNKTTITSFTQCIGIDNPRNLVSIESLSNLPVANLYVCIDDENSENYAIYYSGYNQSNQFAGVKQNEYLTEITRVYDGNIGNDIDQDIKQIKFIGAMITILTKDGRLIVPSNQRHQMGKISIPSGFYQEYTSATFGITEELNIVKLYGGHNYYMTIFEGINSNNETEYWLYSYDNNYLGLADSINQSLYNFTNDVPSELKSDGIKNFYISGGNLYILGNSGKVWATGSYTGLGLGKNYLTNPVGFVCLQDQTKNLNYQLPKVKGCYHYDDYLTCLPLGTMLFEGIDEKIYLTGNNTLMFRNNILEGSWKKIASNVKKFNASTNESSLAYIDNNNDVWVLGNKSNYLGIEDEEGYSIYNFVRLKDIVDNESFDIINNNVKEIKFRSGATYLLTLDNELYVSGITLTSTWVGNYNIGISSTNEDGTTNYGTAKFEKILDNVIQFEAHNLTNFAITCDSDNNYKFYAWGRNDGGLPGYNVQIPTEVTGLPFNPKDVIKMYAVQRISYIITNDGSLYTCGYHGTNGYGVNGTGQAVNKLFAKFDNSVFNNEKIIDVKGYDQGTSIIALTENGNLYGWGIKSNLGIGVEVTDYILTPEKITTISNVSSISSGSGYFVLIKKDGTVWGTGSNTYGILGRWIGIDRNSPNSRYKTAFDWVECPELEI